MPALQPRVTCHTLKKRHVFWDPLGLKLCYIISSKVTTSAPYNQGNQALLTKASVYFSQCVVTTDE